MRRGCATAGVAFIVILVSAAAPVRAADDLLPETIVSVKDRPRPGYEPLGVRLGSFLLQPRLSVGATYDDNIYATESGRTADGIGTVAANLGASSQIGRLPFGLYLGATQLSYADNSSESRLDWQTGGTVGYDLGSRTKASLGGDYVRSHEARNDPSFPTGALQPPATGTAGGMFQISHEFAFGQLRLNADYRSLDFEDARLASGLVLDQDFRDRDALTVEMRGTMMIRKTTGAFLRVVHQEQSYRNPVDATGLNRGSSSNAAYTGAAFEVTNLIRGELGVGVLQVDNRDPAQSDTTSFSVSSNVEFYVTPLITATLDLQRAAGPADVAGSASFVATNGSLVLDYELRRNVILSARHSRTRREYSGIDQVESGNASGVKAKWLLNRRFSVDADLKREQRSWPVVSGGRNFVENVASLSASFTP